MPSDKRFAIDDIRAAAASAPAFDLTPVNQFTDAWHAALDRAALKLLSDGQRDIRIVYNTDDANVVELWVDCGAQVVGEKINGRCVYRQRLATDLDKMTMSIVVEWL